VSEPEQSFDTVQPVWRAVFSGDVPDLRRGRRLFKLISPRARDRCRICLAPFDGPMAPLVRWLGRGPWHRNPHFCDRCETSFREFRGGAELDLAVLFADVRGSTQMAAGMRPAEYGALMQRFYLAATKVFLATDAVVDKMVGDEVIGLYFPGLIDAEYHAAAVRAGMDLLRATGHGSAEGAWLPIGIGVHSGKAFVGSLGAKGGGYEFAALGDTMNVGARLATAAGAGELVISDAVWPHVSTQLAAETRTLDLKGVAAPVQARVVRVS
jgi:adenylate cyclase